MVKPEIVINRYPNQSYQAIFNPKTGMLLRIEDHLVHEPFWCSFGPELMDISITNWCDKECIHCYKGSNKYGSYMSLESYQKILYQATQMRVFQIALGGGNPNQHPDFCEILRLTREEYKIVPTYTTNGRGLNEVVLTSSKKYSGAVAVSAYYPFTDLKPAVQKLLDHGIRTNIHFLLTSESVETAISWLEDPPEILKKINAIIFLNYKPVGRNPNMDLVVSNAQRYSTFFQLAGKVYPFKIGFDSCSISGIARFIKTSSLFLEHCEAGRFSMYISEDSKMYPCSFMINRIDGIPVKENNIQETWRSHDTFLKFRETLQKPVCPGCAIHDICFGGCPIYPEINFC
jgi:radical SAM protein with 4Fe4S-binding SPASM domain